MSMPSKKSGVDFSKLQPELLEIITSKLPYIDILRFKAVCSSYYAAAKRFSSAPLLLRPINQEIGGTTIRVGVLSLRDNTMYDLNVIVPGKSADHVSQSEEVIVGSSHGWLVTINKFAEPFLLNVFSRTRIQLPRNDSIQRLVVDYEPDFSFSPLLDHLQQSLIQKAILTDNPSCNEDYKVIIIYGPNKKLAFCEYYEEESWTGFSESKDYYDLLWFNGMLYTLRGGVTIEAWDFADSYLPTRKMCVQFSTDITRLSFPGNGSVADQWYIVPCMGEILFIIRYIGELVSNTGELLSEGDLLSDESTHPLVCPYRTLKFQVYKVDMIERKLIEVKSLKDQVIFIGANHGFSVSARDYQELKGNSIYFTDDYRDRMFEDYLYGGHDIGIFSLDDESISSVYDIDFLQKIEPTPVWVLPK